MHGFPSARSSDGKPRIGASLPAHCHGSKWLVPGERPDGAFEHDCSYAAAAQEIGDRGPDHPTPQISTSTVSNDLWRHHGLSYAGIMRSAKSFSFC